MKLRQGGEKNEDSLEEKPGVVRGQRGRPWLEIMMRESKRSKSHYPGLAARD